MEIQKSLVPNNKNVEHTHHPIILSFSQEGGKVTVNGRVLKSKYPCIIHPSICPEKHGNAMRYVCNQFIKAGTVILGENPLFGIKTNKIRNGTFRTGDSQVFINYLVSKDFDQAIRPLLNNLYPRDDDQKLIKDIEEIKKDCDNPNDIDFNCRALRLFDKFRFNAFGRGDWSLLYYAASFFNHSCKSNADFTIDEQTFNLRVIPLRDLNPGDEITISYDNVPLNMSRKRRREYMMKMHGFVCNCNRCNERS
jgi:hypothetical protein